MKYPKFLDFVPKPVFLGMLVFCFLLVLTQYLSYERYLLVRETETRELNNEAYAAKGRLQTILSYNLSTAQTLAFIVQKYGVPRDFESVGATLLRSNEFVDAVQLVQGGVITHVYPREGNESVIGYNILKDSLRNSGALTAIKTKQFFWAGPIELKQGGVGIVGRQPLFIDNKFKGFSAVIIRLSTFLKAVGIDSNTTNGFYYQLSRMNEDGSEVFFLPNHQSYKNALIVPIKIPNGEWKLYVGKRSRATLFFAVTFSALGLVLSILGGWFVWYFVRQPEKLNKLVEEKTRQLSKANEEKGTVLNRITDAMISLDNESRITFINQTALNRLFGENQQDVSGRDIIGKKVWELYEGVQQTVFWEKYQQAIQTQKEQEAEGYFKPTNKWLLLKMYPSSDGVTLYSKDISESKKAQEEILLERNFSDSIINSLPGVFYLYDQSGKFIRWNKNFETVSGYSAEEIGSENPPDFFEPEEKKRVLSKIKEALKTGEADEEVLFYTKDKRKIPYYFNGRVINLNGKKYLMGMGIDITERKRTEKQLLLEKNLLESVINSLPGVFYMADVNGRPLRWNKNFEKVTGYTSEEICNMRIADFVAENDQLKLLAKKELAIQQGSSDIEAEFVTKQKEKIPYYFTSLLVKYNEQSILLGIGIDITERKKAEWALLESEEKYRSVIQNSPDIIMQLDLDEKVRFINYTEGGFTPEQIIGASAYDFVMPEYHDLVRETHRRALTTQKPQTYETVSLGLDGIKRWFLTSVGPIVIQGKVTGITLVTRDITERKKAEEAIQQSEEKYRYLFHNNPALIFIWDIENLSILEVNNVALQQYGYTREEMMNMTILQLRPAEDHQKIRDFAKKMLTGEDPVVKRAWRHLKKSGEVMYMDIASHRINYNGQMAILSLAKDITEQLKAEESLKESETRYRALVENAPEALVVMDMVKGKFVSVSKSAEELFGMSKAELLQVGPIELSPEYQPNGELSSNLAMKEINKAIAGGKPHFEWIHLDKNGNLIPCEIWLVRLPSENQILIRGSIVNISERKQAEKEKEHTRYLLNERVKELTTLYKTGRLLQTEHTTHIAVLQEIVNILPAGWQYPEICEARITLGKDEFKTPGYVPSNFHQIAEFKTVYDLTGAVEVVYLEEKPTEAEGPFLAEERNLINMLAEMIRVYLNQKHEAEELNLSYIQLRQLSSHLQTVREEERAGIAREIHDELGQQLTALKMDTSWLTRKIANGDQSLHEKLNSMTALIDDTVKTVRRISTGLRPGILDDLGLIAALEWQSGEFKKRTGIPCHVSTDLHETLIEKNISTGIFRVYQEALTNIMRHAQATLVETSILKVNGSLVVRIRDNGKGFDMNEVKTKNTLGIVGMKERALMFGGELEIKSKKGAGTEIILKVPLSSHHTP